MRKKRKFLILVVFFTCFITPIGLFYFKLQNFEEPHREVALHHVALANKSIEKCSDFSDFEHFEDYYPKCLERFQEVQSTLGSDTCLTSKVSNSSCSIRDYLSQIENACPARKNQQNYAKLNLEVGNLLEKFGNNHIYDFMKTRITRFWPDFVDGATASQNVLESRRKLKILVFFGFLANEKVLKMADGSGKGGPQGELVQWSDLLASLAILGHDIEIAHDMESLKRSLEKIGRHPRCTTSTLINADLLITDIMGFHKLPKKLRTDNRCIIRLLDSFGTHAEFASRRNFAAHTASYQGDVRKRNPWGGLDLELEQHWTYYPHSQDNTFLGFVVRGGNFSRARRAGGKPRALIYGKEKYMWANKMEALKILQEFVEIHATVADGNFDNVINHGLLNSAQIQKLYSEVDIFFGLGFPFEGPAPLEAIANGAIFINPSFGTPQNRKNNEFLGDKPTLRSFSSQNPYAEHKIGAPHVITVDITDEHKLREALRAAIAQPRPEPFVPVEFTARGMVVRVAKLVENQQFCEKGNVGWRRVWPPVASLRVLLAEEGQSCEMACEKKRLVCERRLFEFVNKEQVVKKHSTCSTVKLSDSYSAPYSCQLQSNPSHFSCATLPNSRDIRRICPCRDFQHQQHALCKDC